MICSETHPFVLAYQIPDLLHGMSRTHTPRGSEGSGSREALTTSFNTVLDRDWGHWRLERVLRQTSLVRSSIFYADLERRLEALSVAQVLRGR